MCRSAKVSSGPRAARSPRDRTCGRLAACREGWRPGLQGHGELRKAYEERCTESSSQASQHGLGAIPRGANRETPYGKDAPSAQLQCYREPTEEMTPAEVKGGQCCTPPDTPAKLLHRKAPSPGGHGADTGQVGGTLSSGIQWGWPSHLVLGDPDERKQSNPQSFSSLEVSTAP